MQRLALHVLGERVLLGRHAVHAVSHDTRDHRGLGEPLLLDQEFEGPEAAAAGRHLEHAGLDAIGADDGPDAEALQQGPPRDILGKFLDRDAGLDAPDVGLAEDELIEGNVPRAAEDKLGLGSWHVSISMTDRPRASLPTSFRHAVTSPSLPLVLAPISCAEALARRLATRYHCCGAVRAALGCGNLELTGLVPAVTAPFS